MTEVEALERIVKALESIAESLKAIKGESANGD